MSPRVFDILLSGALLITEHSSLCLETLQGCTYETFHTPKELPEKINQNLNMYSSDDHAASIANNRTIITKNHTWKNRAEMIINTVIKDINT